MEESPTKSVRIRFAPSPTGPLHVGGVRTMLFNWLFARINNGKLILRIEDTDKLRSEKKYELELLDGIKWLGLDWDEGPIFRSKNYKESEYVGGYGPYRQSDRIEIYKNYLQKLLEQKAAYYCYCTKEDLEAERQAMIAQGLPQKYSGHCRNLEKPPANMEPQVIRFKTPEAQVEIKDMIRGKVVFDAALFGDIVIAKNLESPLYNFAATVDDEEMKISHVIRGEEHLSNAPRQILIQKALGFEQPEYAHLPLILNPDRSKMSKRFADTALSDYRNKGYLPEVLINFLALLGWHPKDNREILTLGQLTREFDIKRVQKAGAIFNQEKLDWLQKEHIKNLSDDEITDRLKSFQKSKNIKASKEFLKKIVHAERARFTTMDEFFDLAGFFFELPDYDGNLIIWQKETSSKIMWVLERASEAIGNIDSERFDKETVLAALSDLISEEGRGTVLWPLRAALSGRAASPDPLEIAEVLGRAETLRRIEIALQKLAQKER